MKRKIYSIAMFVLFTTLCYCAKAFPVHVREHGMKRTMFIIIVATVLSLSGCGPIDAFCENYAPEGTTISWTEYNNPEDVSKYFECHKQTIREHEGDTVRVCGWILWPEYTEYYGGRAELAEEPFFELTSSSDPVSDYDGFKYTNVLRGLIAIPEDFWHKKLYVKGTVVPNYLEDLGCCSYTYMLRATYIDTIPE